MSIGTEEHIQIGWTNIGLLIHGCTSEGCSAKFSEAQANSVKFKLEVMKFQPRKVLHVVKTRTIRKWELNTCVNFVNLTAKDLFVGRCRSNIYTM